MNWVIFGAVVVGIAVLGYLAQHFKLIDLSSKDTAKRGGTLGGLTGIGDEIFAPTRHEAQAEMDRQTVLPAPAPVAGDGDKGVYDGKVRIELHSDEAPSGVRRPRHQA